MVDITSLKVRLARLRLGSELDDDPRLEDPAKRDLDKKRGSKKKTKKASKDPYSEYTKNTGGKRKKTNKLTRSDQKRGKNDGITDKEKYEVTKAYHDFYDMDMPRKKKNKLTRSDQKRGKKVTKKKSESERRYKSKDREDYPAGDKGYVDFMDQLDVD